MELGALEALDRPLPSAQLPEVLWENRYTEKHQAQEQYIEYNVEPEEEQQCVCQVR